MEENARDVKENLEFKNILLPYVDEIVKTEKCRMRYVEIDFHMMKDVQSLYFSVSCKHRVMTSMQFTQIFARHFIPILLPAGEWIISEIL